MKKKFQKLIADFEREAFRNERLCRDQAAGRRCAKGIREVVIPKIRELIDAQTTSEQCQTMLDALDVDHSPLREMTDEQFRKDNTHWAICSYMGTISR